MPRNHSSGSMPEIVLQHNMKKIHLQCFKEWMNPTFGGVLPNFRTGTGSFFGIEHIDWTTGTFNIDMVMRAITLVMQK